ncbi:hypothetical protein ABZ214_05335, partial [Streptomyces iakyrus]
MTRHGRPSGEGREGPRRRFAALIRFRPNGRVGAAGVTGRAGPREAKLNRLPFPDDSADIVFSFSSLHRWR